MTGRRASLLAPLPYFAAFVAAPFAVLAGKLAGKSEVFRSFGPQGLTLWLLLAGLAVLASLVQTGRARARQERPLWPVPLSALALGLAAWLLARLLLQTVAQAPDLAPLLDELRLPALILFAGLWAFSFGAPGRGPLAQAGALLGALVVLDFLLTAIMARSLVLGGGYLFGEAPGTADTLATLLCLALTATLDDRPEPGSPRLARWLILAGILSTFSRPGLAAGGLICLLLDRGPLRERLALSGACALGVWMSLTLPLPRLIGGEDLGLGWHLAATMEALGQEPRALFLGLPLDTPMALAMPDFQGLIWDAETEGLPVSVFQIPSSALRLLAAWGLGAPLAALAAAAFCALRGRTRFGLGLCAVLILCGTLTPALHVPATAAALALALASAAQRETPEEPLASARADDLTRREA